MTPTATSDYHIAITGANGFIGHNLSNTLENNDYSVIRLIRSPNMESSTAERQYNLGTPPPDNLLDGVSCVIHLASETSKGASPDLAKEGRAARALLQLAHNQNIPFIYISSQAASPEAPTHYGLSKWFIEQQVKQYNGYIIKPGLVFSDDSQGVAGEVAQLIKKSPILPDLKPSPKTQPIHIQDLSNAILKLIGSIRQNKTASRVFNLGMERPITFTDFLTRYSTHIMNVRRYFIPTPLILITWLLTALKITRLVSIDPNRLKSLQDVQLMDTITSLQQLGLKLNYTHKSLQTNHLTARSQIIHEAWTIFKYLYSQSPSQASLKRYTHYIELQNLSPIIKDTAFKSYCQLLRADTFDTSDQGLKLKERIRIASLLGESDPAYTKQYIPTKTSPLKAVWTLANTSFHLLGLLLFGLLLNKKQRTT